MSTWYPEYVKFIEDMRRSEFKWGTNDCGVAWAAKFVEIVTGINPLPEYVPNYTTARGAVKAMKKLGYDNLLDLARDVLNNPGQHPSTGALGDLALIKTDDAFGYAFGVVNGERVFYRTENGLGTKDLLEAECIFKL